MKVGGGGRGRGRKEHKRRPRVVGFTYASSEVHFRSTESQTFYRSIMTADDSIKYRCANSGMTGQVVASPQTSFGVRLSRTHFSPPWGRNECVTNEPQRTSARRLAKWVIFKIPGFVCKRFLPFFPTPSPLFYLRHFSRGLDTKPPTHLPLSSLRERGKREKRNI